MMGNRDRRRLVTALLLSSVVLASSTGWAQQDDSKRAAAREMANNGARAMDAHQYAEAIDLFTRAEALVHAPPHLLYIARASAQLGKLVQAREMYVKITREELASNAPKAFVEARRAALEEQAALEPRLAKLTITVNGERARDATVTVDGAPISGALVGVPYPVDPGTHALRATAPGWSSDEVKVTLTEGGQSSAVVALTHREELPVAAVAPVATSADGAEEPRRGSKTVAWVALGVGAVGLGAGTFFVLQNRSKRADANALCPDGLCPTSRRDDITSLDDDASRASTFAWVGYAVGAAGVALGATLLLISTSSPKKTAHVTPYVGAGSAGLEGRF